MNSHQRKFNKRVKANRRRAAYLKSKKKSSGASKMIDIHKLVESMEIPSVKKQKKSFFSRFNPFERRK